MNTICGDILPYWMSFTLFIVWIQIQLHIQTGYRI